MTLQSFDAVGGEQIICVNLPAMLRNARRAGLCPIKTLCKSCLNSSKTSVCEKISTHVLHERAPFLSGFLH